MKIGVLTLHRVINKGSTLQTYCGKKILEKKFPSAEVEVVDYRPSETKKRELSKLVTNPGAQMVRGNLPTGVLEQYGKMAAIRDFTSKEFNLSEKHCRTNNIDKAKKFVRSQNYDVISVGSDIVWSARPGGYEPPQPNIFTLPDIEDPIKVSLAASMDQTDEKHLMKNGRGERMVKNISKFDFITVREEYTKQRLIRLGMSEDSVNLVCDPTLLWDFNDIVKTPDIKSPNKKIAAIEIGNIEIKEQLSEHLLDCGYTVLNLLGPTFGNEESLPYSSTVPERLGAYREVDLVLTDRFHGSIFTLKTSQTPIIYIEPVEKYPNKLSKGRDLYQRIGIPEQIWRYDGSIPDQIIDDKLHAWNQNKSKVSGGLKDIRQNSEPHITDMVKTVSNTS